MRSHFRVFCSYLPMPRPPCPSGNCIANADYFMVCRDKSFMVRRARKISTAVEACETSSIPNSGRCLAMTASLTSLLFENMKGLVRRSNSKATGMVGIWRMRTSLVVSMRSRICLSLGRSHWSNRRFDKVYSCPGKHTVESGSRWKSSVFKHVYATAGAPEKSFPHAPGMSTSPEKTASGTHPSVHAATDGPTEAVSAGVLMMRYTTWCSVWNGVSAT